jgi:hypothetical protein
MYRYATAALTLLAVLLLGCENLTGTDDDQSDSSPFTESSLVYRGAANTDPESYTTWLTLHNEAYLPDTVYGDVQRTEASSDVDYIFINLRDASGSIDIDEGTYTLDSGLIIVSYALNVSVDANGNFDFSQSGTTLYDSRADGPGSSPDEVITTASLTVSESGGSYSYELDVETDGGTTISETFSGAPDYTYESVILDFEGSWTITETSDGCASDVEAIDKAELTATDGEITDFDVTQDEDIQADCSIVSQSVGGSFDPGFAQEYDSTADLQADLRSLSGDDSVVVVSIDTNRLVLTRDGDSGDGEDPSHTITETWEKN